MMGTLAAVLATRKIATDAGSFRAEIEGDISDVGGVLRITEIRVGYTLKVPPGQGEDARWAMEHYLSKCPAAQSVAGCIAVEHEMNLEEP